MIQEKHIKVVISDRGIGIPEDELNSIYLPFKRASNVKFKSGFGIGLSLVHKILELHNATLNVTSIVNEGTSIEMVFSRLDNSPLV